MKYYLNVKGVSLKTLTHKTRIKELKLMLSVYEMKGVGSAIDVKPDGNGYTILMESSEDVEKVIKAAKKVLKAEVSQAYNNEEHN